MNSHHTKNPSNPDNRFSEKDIKYLYILTLLSVVVYSSFLVVDILSTFGVFDYSLIYHNLSMSNPFFDILLIGYFLVICLLFFTIKGIIIGSRKKLNRLFSYRLFFIVLLLIVYYPTVLGNLPPICWVLIDALSLGFFICYLMYIPIND
ncbi:MAG: hypothetical protein GY756_07990 [bacterium]|nr:hypothetical protein [bacterium]